MRIIQGLLAGVAASAMAFAFASADPASAQTPKRGGTMVVGYETGEPNTLDCQASSSNSNLLFLAPHYSQLIRYDRPNYPKLEGDVAESWTVSPDGLTYTFKIRPNVKFHDGSTLTAEDVKATMQRQWKPPQGVLVLRQDEFTAINAIETPDPMTVVFKLNQPEAALLTSFANPFNCIYSARRLAADQNYYKTNVMGTGPFVPDEYVKGSSWSVKRFDGYFRPGQPYLDGFKIQIISPNSGPKAFAAKQIDTLLRTMQPQEEAVLKSRPGGAQFPTTSVLVSSGLTLNTAHKPLDDVRVRRALTMAIGRKEGLLPITKITNHRDYGGLNRPGSEFALPPEELAKLPGFGPNGDAAKAEARKLLAEAGQTSLKLKLVTRPTGAYSTLSIFVADEWRKIGVTTELVQADAPQQLAMIHAGDFDAAQDSNSITADDPSIVFQRYVPGVAINEGRYTDPLLVDLYAKQKSATTIADRKRFVNQFETRLLDQAYMIPLFWAGWTSAVAPDIHGWYQTPIYFLGHDHGMVWRD